MNVFRSRFESVPFRYVEFYDVPRFIVFQWGGRNFLLASYFDDEADDYEDEYRVFELPKELGAQAKWDVVFSSTMTFITKVRVKDVQFDASKRKTLRPDFLKQTL